MHRTIHKVSEHLHHYDEDGQCPEPDEMGRQELNSISAWRDGTEHQKQAYIEVIYRPDAIRIAIEAAVASVQPSPFISEYREARVDNA